MTTAIVTAAAVTAQQRLNKGSERGRRALQELHIWGRAKVQTWVLHEVIHEYIRLYMGYIYRVVNFTGWRILPLLPPLPGGEFYRVVNFTGW